MDAKEVFQAALSMAQDIQTDLDQLDSLSRASQPEPDLPVPASDPNKASTPHVIPLAKETPVTPPTNTDPVKVLVSWAHKGENWSTSQATAWESEVMGFTLALRKAGIDADVDLFHSHDAHTDWTRFGQRAVETSDFVLVAMTEAWAQRWSGTNSPHVGAGAAVEADTLKGIFNRNQNALQKKLKIVILGSQRAKSVPHDMERYARYVVDTNKPDTLEDLLRTLTNQPFYPKPALGAVPVLPPAIRQTLDDRPVRFENRLRPEDAHAQDYEAVQKEYEQLSKELKAGHTADLAQTMQRLNSLRAIMRAMKEVENHR